MQPIVCTTQQQTAGYGQRHQAWLTNAHSCIFSIALPIESELCPALSLKVAVILHQSLTELTGYPLFIKWPNDLVTPEGKAAGILLEVVKDALNRRWLVIGVGVNRWPLSEQQQALKVGALPDFDGFALIDRLICPFEHLALEQADLDYWRTHDYFQVGEDLVLLDQRANQSLPVTYQGIQRDGCALVEHQGNLQALHSGQQSLRKQS